MCIHWVICYSLLLLERSTTDAVKRCVDMHTIHLCSYDTHSCVHSCHTHKRVWSALGGDVLQLKQEAVNREHPHTVTGQLQKIVSLWPPLCFYFCKPALICKICKIMSLKNLFAYLTFTCRLVCTFILPIFASILYPVILLKILYNILIHNIM